MSRPDGSRKKKAAKKKNFGGEKETDGKSPNQEAEGSQARRSEENHPPEN